MTILIHLFNFSSLSPHKYINYEVSFFAHLTASNKNDSREKIAATHAKRPRLSGEVPGLHSLS